MNTPEPPPLVLLVDDEPARRTAAATALQAQGFRTEGLALGSAALERLARPGMAPPDAVLVSAHTPQASGISGPALCERLRAWAPWAHLPVVMLVEPGDDDAIERAYRAGASDFFVAGERWPLLGLRLRYLLRAAALREALQPLAQFDTLTGLPNRRQISARCEHAMDAAGQRDPTTDPLLALLLIGLDRFRTINDTLGHGAGDQLLIEVAQRLTAALPPNPPGALAASVGRLGGDEFVVLLPAVASEAAAHELAHRLLGVLREPMQLDTHACTVSASIGVALFPRDGQTLPDLLRSADMAMDAVKDQGRNDVALFHPRLSGPGREQLMLESALSRSIEHGELRLHYQPKVDVAQGLLVGVEALVRWQHGAELLLPSRFIALAEETGFIVPLSEWALREAAAQAQRWHRAFGFDSAIAVNLPGRMFERADLVDHIKRDCAALDVPPRWLQLEITETKLMRDLPRVSPTLQRLQEMGIAISIDDFGTGYSSLAYLTGLALAELKIDRSFVSALGHKPQAAAVVSAVIALARSLHLRVVAEGVETAGQMNTLLRLGCALMQGAFLAPPMSAQALQTWVLEELTPRHAPWMAAVSVPPTPDPAHPACAHTP